ncbi:MAG: glycosyltransferase family 9 protein [Bryobacteraceae bacterium]|nr:glycosyltransferase family 9 protein [Bryobacteraceae bacterium]
MAVKRLLIRPGAIGDCIVALPAMEHLRADFTEVWVPSAVTPLVQFADAVDAIARTGLDQLGLPCVRPDARLVERLRGFDDIVSWYGTNRESFQAAVYALGLPFRFYPALPPADGDTHAADFLMRQAGGPLPATPRIRMPEEPRHFAAIHPFSGGARKNWPLERFRALRLPLPIEFAAGPDEKLAEARRFDTLGELAVWLASASVYIGNDSGISHLAAAVGTPTLALFGPTRPEVWAPRGRRVTILAKSELEVIEIDAVEQAVRDLLSGG